MRDFANQVGKNFHEQTLAMADELVANMKDAAPKDTGTLASSIRKKDVSKLRFNFQTISVLVIGGGQQTTKRPHQGGEAYDYSLGVEFGTTKEAPEPFFYNTYRQYKNDGLEIFKETLSDAIKENNQARALRTDGSNSETLGSASSRGHRGAVVVKGKI